MYMVASHCAGTRPDNAEHGGAVTRYGNPIGQKIGKIFYIGWRGVHEESFKKIQFMSCHIDGSRWTD